MARLLQPRPGSAPGPRPLFHTLREAQEKLLDSNFTMELKEPRVTFGWKFAGECVDRAVEAQDLTDAKAKIRAALGVTRLPAAVRVWDATERPLIRWRPEPVWVA